VKSTKFRLHVSWFPLVKYTTYTKSDYAITLRGRRFIQ